MTQLLDRQLRQALLEQLAITPALYCFLDYDGTLVPFAPHPDLARPVPELLTVLEELARLPNVRVSVVSGRRVHDLRRFLRIAGLHYVGLHGAEFLTPEGNHCVLEPARISEPWIAQARAKLERELAGLPGVWIEDKKYCVACHVREATNEARQTAGQLVGRVYAELSAQGAPLELLQGNLVYELRPRGINKGLAALRLLRNFRSDALAVYAGDDATDEDAFRLLPSVAVTIRVAVEVEPTAARYRVPNSSALLSLLQDLVRVRRQVANSAAPTRAI